MNRTDRLLAIVLELQGKGHLRAEDLAAIFETSKRTVYRDMQALGQAGVPIVSIPGRGYSLIAGYFLPPLSFTPDEATLLLLGADVMAQSFDTHYRAVAQSASRKIAGVLPEKIRDETLALRERILFIAQDRTASAEALGRLQLLRSALLGRQSVQFAYYARHSADHTPAAAAERARDGQSAPSPSAPTQRQSVAPQQAGTPHEPRACVADPYGLAHVGGVWYLTAYDHQRQAIRHFRLDRMEALTLLDRTFTRQAEQAWPRSNLDTSATLTARALFDAEVARWVREAPSFFTVASEETPDGLLVTLRARHEDDILHWLLSWGRHARTLEPEWLRQRIADEAAAILQQHC